MNKSSQRIAIAELCGWAPHKMENSQIRYWRPPQGEQWSHQVHQLPDYCNDLNEMHKAEDLLGDGYKRVHYLDTLCWVCRRDGMNVRWIEAPFANAAQKAEALLYVFGLWEDSESQREAAGLADEKPDGQAENKLL
jgi:hypothetical protein